VHPHRLSFELGLYSPDIQFIESAIVFDRDGGGHAGTLARDGAAHHIARRRMANPIATRDSPSADEIFDALGQRVR
jgi:hypothetical protein